MLRVDITARVRLTSVEGLPSHDDESARNSTERAQRTWDTQHTRGDLYLEQDDNEALPGDRTEVDCVWICAEDLSFVREG